MSSYFLLSVIEPIATILRLETRTCTVMADVGWGFLY